MAYNNKLELTGNLCDDCAIYQDRVVRARVAVTRSRDGSKAPIFVNVSLFTDNADNLDKCYEKLVKGAHVRVSGALDVNTWEGEDGNKHTEVCVIADEIAILGNVFLPLKKRPPQKDKPQERRCRKPAALEPFDDDTDTPFQK